MTQNGCGYALANAGHDTRALQAWLGHKNIRHTVRYTELAPDRDPTGIGCLCMAQGIPRARSWAVPARGSLSHREALRGVGQAHSAQIQNNSGLPQGLQTLPLAGWKMRQTD
jgi:hypothetical protein